MAKAKMASKPSRPSMQAGVGRKGGGYLSDRSMNFNKSQSIEDLTGGRIKKKS